MSRFALHWSVRAVAILLFVWTSADGALYGACPLDPITAAPAGRPSLSPDQGQDRDAQPGHRHDPAHCFCHAQSIGLVESLLFVVPAGSSRLASEVMSEGPESPARDLDHPPQLTAL